MNYVSISTPLDKIISLIDLACFNSTLNTFMRGPFYPRFFSSPHQQWSQHRKKKREWWWWPRLEFPMRNFYSNFSLFALPIAFLVKFTVPVTIRFFILYSRSSGSTRVLDKSLVLFYKKNSNCCTNLNICPALTTLSNRVTLIWIRETEQRPKLKYWKKQTQWIFQNENVMDLVRDWKVLVAHPNRREGTLKWILFLLSHSKIKSVRANSHLSTLNSDDEKFKF